MTVMKPKLAKNITEVDQNHPAIFVLSSLLALGIVLTLVTHNLNIEASAQDFTPQSADSAAVLATEIPEGTELDANTIIVEKRDGTVELQVVEENTALTGESREREATESATPKVAPIESEFDGVRVSEETPENLSPDQEREAVANVAEKIAEIEQNSEVINAQPNYIYRVESWGGNSNRATPPDYDSSLNWYLEKSRLPEALKDQGCPGSADCGGSSDVTIAVIDTGVAYADFDDRGADRVTDANYLAIPEYRDMNLHVNTGEIAGDGLDNDCNGYVDDYNGVDTYAGLIVGKDTCLNGNPIPVADSFQKAGHGVDTYGHGSLVTGVIAGIEDNGAGQGAAFNTTILPIAANIHFDRVFTSLAIRDGLQYALDQGADVVNMSLGGTAPDSSMASKLQELKDAGVIVIAASGNYGTSASVYPAEYDSVISVGAVNSNGSRSSYSSYGPGLDFMAYVGQGPFSPGGAVIQYTVSCYTSCTTDTIDDGGSLRYSIGTSFAAPQVSALAGLILSETPGASFSSVYAEIQGDVTDLETIGRNSQTGFGVINFKAETTEGIKSESTPAPASRPTFRFLNNVTGSHFYTISTGQRDRLRENFSDSWTYEGTSFNAFTSTTANAKPIYRFFSPASGSHFYTISPSQRDRVIANFSSDIWVYEGIAFYAYSNQISNSIPVYRFWNGGSKSHLYTNSQGQRDRVLALANQGWEYEGIVFYAPN